MKIKTYYLGGLLLALTASSCASRYVLTSVSRQRILIDSRYDAQPDAEATAFMTPYKQKVDSVMGPMVGQAAHYMEGHRPESNLSNLLADILVWAGKAYGETPDFGVYNMGGIRAALPKGPVTYGDVLEVAPFENKISFLSLTGEQVMQLFSEMAAVGGEGVSHGVQLVITKDGKLVSAKLHGKEIDAKAIYRIATIDYLAHGNDKLEAFKLKTDFVSPQDASNNARYIIAAYFKEQAAEGKAVDARIEGRIVER